MDALCALLLLQALPSSALWGIGWLLLQIFGLRKAGQACPCLKSSSVILNTSCLPLQHPCASLCAGCRAVSAATCTHVQVPYVMREACRGNNLCACAAGTHMSEMQQQVLHSAVGRAQREMQNEIQGTWCDALACLLALEWPRARKHLLTPVPQSTSVVVQAWMQVGFRIMHQKPARTLP